MSVLVETGDGIAGCLAVLGGRDLSKCYHDDLTCAVEAITGIPGHLYRFFYTNKKITSDLSLHDQGLLAGHRLNLHVTIRGGMPSGASDQCTVKVINLVDAVTEQELHSLFTPYGEIASVHLRGAKGTKLQHAFVNFKTHEDALMAIKHRNQHPVRGKPIHCTLQAPKGTTENTTVFPVKVIDLDDSVTEMDLDKLFSQFGRVAKVVIKSTGTGRIAFVNFLSESEQRQAYSHLDGTRLRTKSISVSVQSERMILLSKDQATVIGGPSSSSRSSSSSASRSFFDPGRQVLAASQTAELSCSDVAMRFLVRALFTLDDENATAVIQQLERKHDVKIEKNSESKIAITGLPGCIESAQKEITQGDLLGTFAHRVHNIPAREANMNLIQRCGLDVVESQCRVICFMHFQAPAQSHYGGSHGRGAKIGTVVIEVCGTIDAEVEMAFKKLKQLKIENEAWPLGDGEDYNLLDQWQRSGRLAKLQGETEFVLDRKNKVLYCNALCKDVVESQMADVKQRVGEQSPQVVRVSLSAVQREFLQHKRRDELEMFWAEHQVKAVFEDGCLAISGLSNRQQKARQEVDKLLAKCGTATVVIDQRQCKLSGYFHAAYGGVKSEVEDSLDALVLLPTESAFYSLGGSRRGGGASSRGRGQGRGRERGGARGHRYGSSSHGDGDGSDGEGAAVELCIHVMAGSAAQCQNAEQQIRAIGLAMTHLTISIPMQRGTRIINALKEKKIRPHLHRARLFVKGTAVHVNAMTQDEAEQMRDAVTEFVASELVTQDHYHFSSVVVGYLAVTREMPRLRQLAKECSGVRFNQVRTENRTDRPGSAGLTVSGKPADVLRFRGNLDHLSATLAAGVKVEQVPAEGLAGTALSECAGEIRTIERNHGVLCSWTDGREQQHGSTAGLDDDDDGDNDAAATQHLLPTLPTPKAGGFFSTSAMSMFPGIVSSSKVTAPSPSATTTTGHWEWKDDTGWKTYTPAVCAELDKFKAVGDVYYMHLSGQIYEINPQAKNQTNMTTGFARPIRYVAPSLPHPTAVPVASSAGASSLGRAEWLFQDDDALPKCFCPVQSGLVVALVNVQVEGTDRDVAVATIKIKQLLLKAVTEASIPVPIELSHSLLTKLQSLSKRHLVRIVINSKSPTRTASAATGSANCVVVIRGAQKRTEQCERLVQNLLLKEVLRVGMAQQSGCPPPREWESQRDELELKQVSASTIEFSDVLSRVKKSLPNAVLVRVERIQNRFLWKKYVAKRDSIAKKIGQASEEMLFHGTRNNPPEVIYRSEEGFETRFSSKGLWGEANYFAVDARYSDAYAHKPTPHSLGSDQQKQMFLAKVIVGDSIELPKDSKLNKPPVKPGASSDHISAIRYDTVNGITQGFRVYMVYADSQAYPFYLLTYRTQ